MDAGGIWLRKGFGMVSSENIWKIELDVEWVIAIAS
jgi:hypothetical protein